MTEFDAETLLVEHLSRLGVVARRQVPLGLKVVDVVADWAGGDSEPGLEGIEVKLNDWRRATDQAVLDGHYVDRVSIALPSGHCSRVDLAYLAELGVGLIEITHEGVRRVLLPRHQPVAPSVSLAVRRVLARDA